MSRYLSRNEDDNEDDVHRRTDSKPVHIQRTKRVTAGELRKAVADNPVHPVAKVYAKAVAGMRNKAILFVDATDFAALVSGGRVNTIIENDGPRDIIRKELVPLTAIEPPLNVEACNEESPAQ